MAELSDASLAALSSLILRFDLAETVSQDEAEELLKAHLASFMEAAMRGADMTSRLVTSASDIPDSDPNDLSAHIQRLDHEFTSFFNTGLPPAPYPAWRVCIILRRAKLRDSELSFLRAWCRHFPRGNGQRYADLMQRLNKLEQR